MRINDRPEKDRSDKHNWRIGNEQSRSGIPRAESLQARGHRLEAVTAPPLDAKRAHNSRVSIFLRRIVSSMFMRVNSRCAHQVRPPVGRMGGCSARQPRGDFSRGNSATFVGIRISAVSVSPWIPSQIGANVSVRGER